MTNTYLVDEDIERSTARRAEIKRAIAQRELNRQRIVELSEIMRKLDVDSDDAAERHAIATGELQRELDVLDKEHVDRILEGKTSTAKSLSRRSEILSELASLNTELESRCEANKRSKQPFQKQIEELRTKVANASNLESELLRYCGAPYRIQQAIDELTIRIYEIAVNEAMRRQSIHEINYNNENSWDEKNRRKSDSTIIHKKKLEESKAIVGHFRKKMSEALRASEASRKHFLEN